VVAVRLPEATEALARGIASVIGHDITAVCVIEPDAVVVLVVDTSDGAVQTAVNHTVTTDEDLARWLSAIFAQADWRPEALVLVGSGSDLDAITPHLEDVLSVPVFVPAEAQLALARGAAMASAHGPDFFLDESAEDSERVPTTGRSRPMSHVGAASVMLGVGVVTFVVSGSLALGLQLTSGESAKPADDPPAAGTSDEPAAVKSVRPVPAAAPRIFEALPPPPPAELLPPPEVAIEPAPVAETLAPEAPAPDPLGPVDGTVPGGAPLPPGVTDPAPGIIPASPTPVPEEEPGILRRLKDKLSGIGKSDDPAQAPADVEPPPQDPLLPPPDAPPPPPPG